MVFRCGCNVDCERFSIVSSRVVTNLRSVGRRSENRSQEHIVEQRRETVNLVEFWGLPR